MFKNLLKNNIIISTFHEVYFLLLPAQRIHALKIILFILFGSMMDVLGVVSILPVMFMALNTSVIYTNKWLNFIYTSLGYESENLFLFSAVLFLLFLYTLKNFISILVTYYQSRFCYGVATNFSKRQFLAYYRRGYLFFKTTNSNEIFCNIDMIPSGFIMAVMLPMLLLISEAIVLAIILTTLCTYHPQLFFLLLLLLVPGFLLPYQVLKGKMYRLGKSYLQIQPANGKNMFEAIFGYVDSVLSGRESYFLNKYVSTKKNMNLMQAKLYTLESVPVKIVELTAIAGIVIIFTYIMFLNENRDALLPLLSMFVAAAFRIMPSMSRILNALMKIKGWKHSAESLQDLKGSHEEQALQKRNSERIIFEDKIIFENVTYKFPDTLQNIINQINLYVHKGDAIGIFGKSGSGKSTLINLLLRFLKEQSGNITVDGMLLTEKQTQKWRNSIGYVKQDTYILDATLAENIAFGIEPQKIEIKKIYNAISMACLDEFLHSLPNGIQTDIGEQGGKISGGQKQRIGIARALYNEAELLILDEATSQLDAQTEAELIKTIEKLINNRVTLIIIAHRLSTLKKCNKIFKMENGKLTETSVSQIS